MELLFSAFLEVEHVIDSQDRNSMSSIRCKEMNVTDRVIDRNSDVSFGLACRSKKNGFAK